MIKISALDFLNIDFADVDILDRSGNVILEKGSPITQQWMLKHYFKEIFVEEVFADNLSNTVETKTTQTVSTTPVQTIQSEVNKEINKNISVNEIPAQSESIESNEITPPSVQIQKTESVNENLSTPQITPAVNIETTEQQSIPSIPKTEDVSENVQDAPALPAENNETVKSEEKTEKQTQAPAPVKEKEPEEPPVQLKFDEEVAKEMETNAEKLAKMFGFTPREIEDIKKTAHYCNASLDQFTTADIKKKDFGVKKAKLSYDMIQDKLGFSEMVKDSILSHENPYDSALFGLAKKIPYAHIVSIVSNYYTLRQMYKGDKEKTLRRMLEYGGNKFNIFVLHKFIRMMRSA